AEEDLALVVHLGDYIYEGDAQGTIGRGHVPASEIFTLDDYRRRYGQYKGDPDLRAAHARHPFTVTWDDHEVENNYADEIPQDERDREGFLRRRADAYQAYYEHQPLRLSARAQGPDLRLYRRLTFGRMAEFNGDVHKNYVSNIERDFSQPQSELVGTEFVTTSISTGGDGTDQAPDDRVVLAENPHITFANRNRGYVRCTLDRGQWRSDFRIVPYVTRPGAPVSIRASFVVEDGRPGAQEA
ncbi:MAG TPA: alkaline phosphatase D family protein, partial [Solirubrobacteraceae bacterium]|nr:alkaline phosphatase D family protein [Solirubrobacteraceae bacterium]